MSKKYAFIFPGQGSQSVGMGSSLEDEPQFSEYFDRAGAVLGYDLLALVKGGPAEELDRTRHTQPALLTLSTVIHRLWLARGGPAPTALAGHSLGEYSALVAAEALDFEVAVELVAERGQLMQSAVPAGEGAMTAIIGLEDTQVEAICAAAAGKEVLSAANYNAPGQVVISGARSAVAAASAAACDAGARMVTELAVSVPSHCELMRPAAEALAGRIDALKLREPRVPVIQNVEATPASGIERIRNNLLAQLYSPVRWSDGMCAIRDMGITHFCESGPGKVLTGLARRIDKSLQVTPIGELKALQAAVEVARSE